MTSRAASVIVGVLLVSLAAAASDTSAKRNVNVTHYGYPGDPHASAKTRLGLGDHNNILNPDSVAVSPDLDRVFPFGSRVLVNGQISTFDFMKHSSIFARWTVDGSLGKG